MSNRKVVLCAFVSIALLVGCGSDRKPAWDAAVDAGAQDSGDSAVAGQGGGGAAANGGADGTLAGAGGADAAAAAGAGGAEAEVGAGGSDGGEPPTYAIGGEVSGLSGTGLLLRNNGSNDLTITKNGKFEFTEKHAADASYAVTVATQPLRPTQTCTVTDGSGTIGSSDVTSIAIACSTDKYLVRGSVVGLAPINGYQSLDLSNGADSVTVLSGSTTFTFPTALESGAAYAVAIIEHPAGQTCWLSNASGIIGSSDASVVVTCVANVTLTLESLFSEAIARWQDTGASDYTLRRTSSPTCTPESMSCPDASEYAHVTSPFHVPNLQNGTTYYFTLTATYAGDFKLHAKSAARPNAPVFDADVRALAASGLTTYVGGDFAQLSLYTGAATPVDRASGFTSALPNFPNVDGEVYAVETDDSGGYYVGGLFSRVGGQLRSNLAHIQMDGALDTAWSPAADGAVRVLLRRGTTLYLAGDFSQLGTESRAGLAAIGGDGTVTSWDPNPNGGVAALALLGGDVSSGPGSDVIVGGSYTTIAGQPRANLAVIDATGNVKANWTPNPDGAVRAIATNVYSQSNGTFWVGGDFQNIGGKPCKHFAALSLDGSAHSWHPDPDQWVGAIAVDGMTIYVAGAFTTLGGVSRAGLAALVPEGAVTSWNPAPDPPASVRTIKTYVDVYLGGSFRMLGGAIRRGVAAVSGEGSGAATAWNPQPNGPIDSLAFVPSGVVLGGEYTGIGGVSRARLAAFQSGQVTSWNPTADDSVDALVVSGSTVYAGGSFMLLGGVGRANIGAIDSNGAVSAWNPSADNGVLALATSGATVYAGGYFANIGGAARARIAALDASGSATAWDPSLNGAVRTLLSDGATVYAGGEFSQIGGSTTRNRIVAIDATSALPTGWDPNADGTVQALALFGRKVVAGGAFANIGGAANARLAALDVATGGATTWLPDPDAPVRALAADGGTLYVAGEFLTVSGGTRNSLAVYDDTFGLLAGYHPSIDGAVNALAVSASTIQVGGELTYVDGVFSDRFASLPKPQ
jgi:trimeric autotransporter adhesin